MFRGILNKSTSIVFHNILTATSYFLHKRTLSCIFYLLSFYSAWVITQITKHPAFAAFNRYNVHRYEIVAYVSRVITKCCRNRVVFCVERLNVVKNIKGYTIIKEQKSFFMYEHF